MSEFEIKIQGAVDCSKEEFTRFAELISDMMDYFVNDKNGYYIASMSFDLDEPDGAA